MFNTKKRDIEVINLIKSGFDNKAVAMIYNTSFSKVKSYVLKNSGNLQDAEDVFQESIIGFYRYIKLEKFNTENDIDAFVFQSAKNIWINHCKKKAKYSITDNHVELENNSPANTQEFPFIKDEQNNVIQETIGLLGDKCKEILYLSIYNEASSKEIAMMLNYNSEDSAKTQLYKCKKKLIDLVGTNINFKKILQNEN